jgi:hypothetical protein
MTTTNKNGFEIRLEVLKMAKEMMDQQYHETANAYWNTINTLAETWNKSAAELIEQTQSMKPAMYSPQDIMTKAQELYGFVAKKD